jgi:hypothetical protein
MPLQGQALKTVARPQADEHPLETCGFGLNPTGVQSTGGWCGRRPRRQRKFCVSNNMTDKVPKDAIFQLQPEDAKGASATKAQMKMITDAYYGTASQGRDTMFDRLKRKFPDTHPPRRAIQRFLNRPLLPASSRTVNSLAYTYMSHLPLHVRMHTNLRLLNCRSRSRRPRERVFVYVCV